MIRLLLKRSLVLDNKGNVLVTADGETEKQAEQNAAKETLQMMTVNIQDFIK